MFSSIKAIQETIVGLLVDDGSLAVGILIALAASGLIAATNDGLVGAVVWMLAAVLPVLLIANLYRSGRKAERSSSE